MNHSHSQVQSGVFSVDQGCCRADWRPHRNSTERKNSTERIRRKTGGIRRHMEASQTGRIRRHGLQPTAMAEAASPTNTWRWSATESESWRWSLPDPLRYTQLFQSKVQQGKSIQLVQACESLISTSPSRLHSLHVVFTAPGHV